MALLHLRDTRMMTALTLYPRLKVRTETPICLREACTEVRESALHAQWEANWSTCNAFVPKHRAQDVITGHSRSRSPGGGRGASVALCHVQAAQITWHKPLWTSAYILSNGTTSPSTQSQVPVPIGSSANADTCSQRRSTTQSWAYMTLVASLLARGRHAECAAACSG